MKENYRISWESNSSPAKIWVKCRSCKALMTKCLLGAVCLRIYQSLSIHKIEHWAQKIHTSTLRIVKIMRRKKLTLALQDRLWSKRINILKRCKTRWDSLVIQPSRSKLRFAAHDKHYRCLILCRIPMKQTMLASSIQIGTTIWLSAKTFYMTRQINRNWWPNRRIRSCLWKTKGPTSSRTGLSMIY